MLGKHDNIECDVGVAVLSCNFALILESFVLSIWDPDAVSAITHANSFGVDDDVADSVGTETPQQQPDRTGT